MHYSKLTSINMPKNYYKAMVNTADLLAYFGVCKIRLVLQIEYHRNIQILIYKSNFSMWQYNLEPMMASQHDRSNTNWRNWRNGKGVWKGMDPWRVQPWVFKNFHLNSPMVIIRWETSSNYHLNSSSTIKHA